MSDYFTILALTDEPDDKISLFFDVTSRHPVRHPDKTKWWGQPNRQSRDQLLPILCYGVLRNETNPFLKDVLHSHLRRGLVLAWNTRGDGSMDMPWKFPDITGPETLGLWLRIFKPFGYKLLLPLCDLETLVDSVIWKFWPPSNISRNEILVGIAHRSQPSIVSRLADKFTDYDELIDMWNANTSVTNEYPTGPLMTAKLEEI